MQHEVINRPWAKLYDRHARPLPPLKTGNCVAIRLPEQKTWTPGVCTGQHGPRSFWIRVNDRLYRRNRRDIRNWNRQPPPDDPDEFEAYEQPIVKPNATPPAPPRMPELHSPIPASPPTPRAVLPESSVAVSTTPPPEVPLQEVPLPSKRYPTRDRRAPRRLIQE